MGSDSTDVGNKGPPRKQGPTRKPGRPKVENLAGPDAFPELRIEGEGSLRTARVCGAMTQQHGDSVRGNVSAPQKFVRLVGCHDPNARSGSWVRSRQAPPKR